MNWRRKDRDAELERELRAHLDLEAAEYVELGASREEARFAAQRALGNTTYIQEEVRSMWGFQWVEVLGQDLRYGARQFARTPAFSIVAVITLALGIGANTAIFSAMNAILLRYLPVPNPQQLVYLSATAQPGKAMQSGDGSTSLPEPMFEELRGQRQVFSDLVAFVPLGFSRIPVRIGAVAEEAQVDMVSGNFFSGLGVAVVRGRSFGMEDEKSHAPLAIISDDWWTRRFARDPGVLGQTIYVNSVPMTIVGVAGAGFSGLEHSRPTDVWIPLQSSPLLKPWGLSSDAPYSLYGSPNWWCLKTMGRLARGVTAERALVLVNPVFQRLAYGDSKPDPQKPPVRLQFIDARGLESAGERYRQPLSVLMAMVGLTLVIACANIALLLVARNAARRREFGLRLAVGGSRARIFRQLLTESLLLVVAGGSLGWLFSFAATRALEVGWALDFDLSPDRTVLLFTGAIAVSAALIFSLAPLRGILRVPIGLSLKTSSANSSQDRSGRTGSQIVVALQMALCLVLLVGAGLLVRTLQNLQATNLGLRTEGLLVFGLSPKAVVHSADEARRFTRNLLARMRSLPGIESATVMDNRIGSGWSNNTGMFKVDGVPAGPDAHLRWTHAGPDYFQVLGTPLVMGRDLRDSDSETAPKVIIVNETFARKYLAGSQPLGHTVGIGQGLAFSIVGVVKDSKFTEVSEEIRPTAYMPYFQSQIGIFNTLQVEVRTMGDPLLHLAEIRRAVAGLGPDLALMQPMTQRAQFDLSFAQERLFGRFAMFFGLLAVLLVGTGLYGTLAFAVTRRTAEVGVRMALGAQRGQVLWMVMRGSLVVCAGSVVVGLPAAIAAARFLRSMLFGVTPGDALTYGVAISGILAVALIASLIPARRAASVDPMVALRQE